MAIFRGIGWGASRIQGRRAIGLVHAFLHRRKAFFIGKGVAWLQQKRIGMIGIFVRERGEAAKQVNGFLSEFGGIVVARVGVPYRERGLSVISLIVDGTNDEIGALAGKLGSIPSVTVRSMLAPLNQ